MDVGLTDHSYGTRSFLGDIPEYSAFYSEEVSQPAVFYSGVTLGERVIEPPSL